MQALVVVQALVRVIVSDARRNSYMNSLNLVLKLTERCNLNCSYCYYFNGLDESFKDKPALLSADTLKGVVSFLEQGIVDLNIKHLGISLHGGEPLLMPKSRFVSICESLTHSLSCKLDSFSLSLQTNGVLIDKEWIQIFRKYQVKIGVSLDGPAEYHNKYRIDHKGRASYHKVEKAIQLLQEENYDFGVLSVIDPLYDPVILYNHIVNVLNIKGLDFLWPDFTHDRPPPHSSHQYGDFMIKIFELWVQQDDPTVQVRFLNSYLSLFLGGTSLIYGIGSGDIADGLHLLTIRGDGEIGPTDELMSTDPSTVTLLNANVNNTSLKEFFAFPIFNELDKAFSHAPDSCNSCCWKKCCGGGGITNRFSKEKRFNNPSVYCEGLKDFYSAIFQYLMRSGIPYTQIKQRLLN